MGISAIIQPNRPGAKADEGYGHPPLHLGQLRRPHLLPVFCPPRGRGVSGFLRPPPPKQFRIPVSFAKLVRMIRPRLGLLGVLLTSTFHAALSAASPPDFTREVRPILARHCFKCHGPDDAKRKSQLRLDQREDALRPAKSGAIALVPGQAPKSELVKRILSADPDEVMPPPSTKSQLSAAEKETLQQWITDGAEYRPHWAFVPPRQAPLPAVKAKDWPHNPVDHFVLARLEAEGLATSEPASRHSLVRRVYLDLIGLPPTPEEADAFVQDTAKDAYEKLVDGLLQSPHYGERWGRRWMDLARYADTNGYEKDRQRTIWPWRDWVINAINADLPFDQFTVEQLAGDLLPEPTLNQRIATGFHRNTMLNEEGGIDPLEFRFLATIDRVNTTGTTWLGLTVGCVQCHTHKYDPLLHREYYQLMALLNNAEEPDLDLPPPGAAARQARNLLEADRLLAELPQRFPITNILWHTPPPISAEAASGERGRILTDGSVLFDQPAPERDVYTLVIDTEATGIDSLRLETLTDDALPKHGPGRVAHGNFVLGEIVITAAPRSTPDQVQPVKVASVRADVEQKDFPASNLIDGHPETGWAVDVGEGRLNTPHQATLTLAQPVGFPGGTRWVIRLEQPFGSHHLVGRPRVSFGTPDGGGRSLAARRTEAVEKRFADWLTEMRSRAATWIPLRPGKATSNSPLLTPQPDASVLASGDITKSDTYDLSFAPEITGITAVRLEALPDERLPRHGPGLAYYEGPKGDFFLGEFQLTAGDRPVKFASATHSYAKNNFGSNASASLAVDGDPQTGWSTAGREGERHSAVFNLAEPTAQIAPWQLKLFFGRHYACSLGRFRISVTTRPGGAQALDLPEDIEALLAVPDAQLTPRQRQALREQCLLQLPELATAAAEIQKLRRPAPYPTTMVLRERPPENPRLTHRHNRGEYLQPVEVVTPGAFAAVAEFTPDLPRNRLGLARWLVSRSNPLTARVTVNRQWQALFGRGLVRTTDDFGLQGEAPSHPELLDWLAVEFMNQGWSLKKLHRLMVLSATYQQASRTTPDRLARDSENRLLSRGPRSRLDAEAIRDSVLQASGLLSSKMGGPSVYPPQPSGVTEAAYGGASWPASSGEDRYRRSVYTFMKRSAPFALFNTFDAPSGEACIARRDVSNTPMQALTLLNDVLLVDASRALGRLLMTREGTVEERVRYGFRRCTSRPPTEEETAALTRFFQAQQQRVASGELNSKTLTGENSDRAAEWAAWITLARALLNLDETITKG